MIFPQETAEDRQIREQGHDIGVAPEQLSIFTCASCEEAATRCRDGIWYCPDHMKGLLEAIDTEYRNSLNQLGRLELR